MSLLDLVRGCTFDDFLFTPQLGVVPEPRSGVDRSQCPLHRTPDAEPADRVGQHGHRSRARRWRSCWPKRAASASSIAGFAPATSRRRSPKSPPSSGRSTASSRIRTRSTSDAASRTRTRLMDRPASARSSSSTPPRRLKGLLTERDVRFVPGDTARRRAHDAARSAGRAHGPISLADAEAADDRAQDQEAAARQCGRHGAGARSRPRICSSTGAIRSRPATSSGRLRVGAAVGATGDYLERAAEVLRAGADVLVIDIAHGHSHGDGAGDRAAAASASATSSSSPATWRRPRARGFSLERGVNGIKVGIGPGGGCTTRLTTNFGVPQVEALVQCRAGRRRPRPAHRRRRHQAATAASRRRCSSAATR